MRVERLPEPELEFGGGGRHVDIRFGLMQFGPLDRGSATAPGHIKVGLVGTPETMDGVTRWLEQCRAGLVAKDSHLVNLFPPFPGCSAVFGVDLVLDPSLRAAVQPRAIQEMLERTSARDAVDAGVELFLERATYLAEDVRPHVLVVAPPGELLDALERNDRPEPLDEGAQEEEDEEAQPIRRRAFHDVLKARGMRHEVPIQMMRPETYDERGRGRRGLRRDHDRRLQDPATRAWNLLTALYYKANGTPWRIARGEEYAACYVGVSFYKTPDEERVLTSMAQVFNTRGDGVVVRGGPARADRQGRNPHLEQADAQALLAKALETYYRHHLTRPARVIVHKSSSFDEGELAGFRAAASAHGVAALDLVSLYRSFTRLFRRGYYPPLRGTLISLDNIEHVLYLKGSVDYFRTWPGMYVPRPVGFRLEDVQESARGIAQEMLALSKLNWNNTQFDGGWPITVRAAQRVGAILKHIGDGDPIQARYSFYM